MHSASDGHVSDVPFVNPLARSSAVTVGMRLVS